MTTEDEIIEIQDGLEVSEAKKIYRSHNVAKKLEAINWARKNSIHSASRKFNVDRKIIRNWMKNEKELEEQNSLPGGQDRKRLGGGGRKMLYPDLVKELADWVKEIDGSADDKIACFKTDGSIGAKGLDVLRKMRATSKAKDYSKIMNEEADAEYGEEEADAVFGVDLNTIEDEIDLFFDIDS